MKRCETQVETEAKPAGPAWLKQMGFTPVKGCDGWRKRMFSPRLGQMVAVIVPESATKAQAMKELERFCPSL